MSAPRLADLGFEVDGGQCCENCLATGRAARIREDARSGRWLCKDCEPNPTSDGLRRLRNGGLGEPLPEAPA